MRPKPIPAAVTVPFLLAEGGLYAAFLAADLAGGESVALKYAAILLCLAFAGLCALRGGDRLVFPALLLTAGADLFLLVLNRHYGVGVALFLVVQSLYLLRLRLAGAWDGLPLRLALPLLAGLALWRLGMATPLNLLAGLYFSQLVCNAILAWTRRGMRLFALGLTLFVGCDVCVGLHNLAAALPHALARAAGLGMWLFYLPSQVLIVLSALPKGDAL